MKLVIDDARVGTKGYPVHWRELGMTPPLIEVDDDDKRAAYVASRGVTTYQVPTPAAKTLSVPPPTALDYGAAVQARIDAVARARAYADGVTCASYAASTNPIWAADAAAFIAWRDVAWSYAYEQLGLVESGKRPTPTISELVAGIPAIAWPS